MEYISAGEYAGNIGFKAFVDNRTGGHGRKGDAQLAGKFIFRDKTAGKQQSIAGNLLLSTRNGLAVSAYFCKRDAGNAVFSLNVYDRMGKLEGNIKILEALDDISLQPAGIRKKLCHDFNGSTFQSHAPRHDEPDVAGA